MSKNQSSISNNLLFSKLDKENIEVLKNKRLEILESEYFSKVLIENRNLEQRILYLQHENYLLSTQLHNLTYSISWRLTQPLRWFYRLSKNIFRTAHQNLTLKTYQSWIKKYEVNDKIDNLRDLNTNFIIVIDGLSNNDLKWGDIEFTLKSILNQTYSKFNIIIISKNIETFNNKLNELNSEVHLFDSIHNLNDYLQKIKFDWLITLRDQDQLSKNALLNIAKIADKKIDAEIIYSDHDELIKNDNPTFQNRDNHSFKSDWNKYLFLNQHYISRSFAISKNLLEQNGFFIEGDFSTDFYRWFINYLDLSEIQNIKYSIFHIDKILWHFKKENHKADTSIYLKSYLNKFDFLQDIEKNSKINLNEKIKSPLVSIIIPTKNSPDLISRCILSIIKKTTYKNYEIIIIDNGSTNKLAIEFINSLPKDLVKIIIDSSDFNYSKLNNQAVRQAKGDYICLLNNDTEIIAPNWLNEMMVYSLFPDVGCVGAKLLFANNSIQHAGVILGIGVVAGHQFAGLGPEELSYANRANLVQELSAVTGACLLVKKKLYEEVGGLNEENLSIAFNDIDFCLKIKQIGYKNIWTPHALLYHYESVSRGIDDSSEKKLRLQNETNYMLSKWSSQIKNDEYYNRNLTLENGLYQLAFPPRL